MTKETFYLGAAIKKAPPDYRVFCEYARDHITHRCRLEPLVFLGDARPEGVSVYGYDIDLALRADYGVFLCDHPSTGMGMEIQARHAAGKPLILLARDPRAESSMLFDFARDHGYVYQHYTSDGHLAEVVELWLGGHLRAA